METSKYPQIEKTKTDRRFPKAVVNKFKDDTMPFSQLYVKEKIIISKRNVTNCSEALKYENSKSVTLTNASPIETNTYWGI